MEYKYDFILLDWTSIGDYCNREFFKYYNGQPTPTWLRKFDDEGRDISDPLDMRAYVDNF